MAAPTRMPLVSCLMVTRDRPALARRAIRCFSAQTWPERELVIVDDGSSPYHRALDELPDDARVIYLKTPHDPRARLGALRNLALSRARGDFCVQWDDDEWYHPRRIEAQMQPIVGEGADASLLDFTLMHCDTAGLSARPFRTGLRFGTPGSLLHRRDGARYPNRARAEDSAFARAIRLRQTVAHLGRSHSHLLVRCYHGDNTWDAAHFTARLRRGPLGRLRYAKAKYIDGDVYRHPAFALDVRERAAAEAFLAESRALGLLRH